MKSEQEIKEATPTNKCPKRLNEMNNIRTTKNFLSERLLFSKFLINFKEKYKENGRKVVAIVRGIRP